MLFSLRKSLVAALVFALLALLTLSACGGGDDDDDSGDNGGNDPTATEDSGDNGGDDDGDDDDGEATPTEDTGGDDGGDDGDDGGDDGDDGGDPELGELACSLLTPDDIESVTGVTMSEGEPSSIAEGFGDCRWEDDDFNSVSTSVVTGPGAEVLFELDLGNEREDVDGVGDRAHYLPGIFPLLEFLEDDVYVSINVSTDAEDEETKDQAIALGQIASDNLP